jgi:hypothetical protein
MITTGGKDEHYLMKSKLAIYYNSISRKEIGLEELGNRIYRIYFREFFLGYTEMKELKVYGIMNYKNELKL